MLAEVEKILKSGPAVFLVGQYWLDDEMMGKEFLGLDIHIYKCRSQQKT